MINISDCPVTGLQRKVRSKDFHWYEDARQIILKCKICHYKDGELVENARIRSYERDLVASNSLVHPQTGALLTEQQLADIENLNFTPIEEYDYYVQVVGANAIVLPTFLNQIVSLRDQQQKFDI